MFTNGFYISIKESGNLLTVKPHGIISQADFEFYG